MQSRLFELRNGFVNNVFKLFAKVEWTNRYILWMSDQKTPWTPKPGSDNNCFGAVIRNTYNKRVGLGGPRNCAI